MAKIRNRINKRKAQSKETKTIQRDDKFTQQLDLFIGKVADINQLIKKRLAALLEAATDAEACNIIISNLTELLCQKRHLKEAGVLNKGEATF